MNHDVLYHYTGSKDYTLKDYVVPALRALPEWYKKLEAERFEETGHVSVKTCVSFLYMWQNSYLIKSPCEVELVIGPSGYECYVEDPDAVRFQSHTHEEMEPRSQMGTEFDPNWLNLKWEFPLSVMTNEHRFDLVWMQPFYWDQQQELVSAPGILPILPDRATGLNCNTFVNKSVKKTITIPKGFPLAMVYSPSGPVRFIEEPDYEYFIKTSNMPGRIFPAKEYYMASKKCPMHNSITNDIDKPKLKGGNKK